MPAVPLPLAAERLLVGEALGRLSRLVGRAAHTVRADPFVAAFEEWIEKLDQAAGRRWQAAFVRYTPCMVPVNRAGGRQPCAAPAVAPCACCSEPTCIVHAMVAQNADVICLKCVNVYVRLARQARKEALDPHAKIRRAHLATLGLKPGAPWHDVEAAYKRLMVRWHPDKNANKDKAHAKFVAIRAAFDWLRADTERKVA